MNIFKFLVEIASLGYTVKIRKGALLTTVFTFSKLSASKIYSVNIAFNNDIINSDDKEIIDHIKRQMYIVLAELEKELAAIEGEKK